MDQFVNRIFQNKTANPEKLTAYGFRNGKYERELLGGQFFLTVRADENSVSCTLTDRETDEPYTLHLVESAEGSFVGEVRAAYEAALCEIADRCFQTQVCAGAITKEIIEYVRARYGDELEFLWNDPNGIWRRKDTGKWYGVFMTVSAKRLGREGGAVEIFDFRMEPEELERRVDGVRVLRGYHMNKKHWVTVFPDGSLPTEEIFRIIDNSYELAVK